MNKKLLTAVGVGSIVLVVGLAATGLKQTQPDDEIDISTSKTKDVSANEKTEKSLPGSKINKDSAKPRTTEYRVFDEKHFKSHQNKQRLLFFKQTGNEPSDQVHAIFSTYLNEFKKGIIIYRADLATSQELAAEFAITRPGSVLKFDQHGTVQAIYIAPERPEVNQLRQVLDI